MVKCYNDFLQLIDGEQLNNYHLVLQESDIIKSRWTKEDYINYLGELELHKFETGVTISYQSSVDAGNRICSIDILIHFPEENGVPERNYTMLWTVFYNNK